MGGLRVDRHGALAVVAYLAMAPRGLCPDDADRVHVGMSPAEVVAALGRPPGSSWFEPITDDDPRWFMGHTSPPLFDTLERWESGGTVITVRYLRGRVVAADARGGGCHWSEFVGWVRSGF
jgi:hypothetical protein